MQFELSSLKVKVLGIAFADDFLMVHWLIDVLLYET